MQKPKTIIRLNGIKKVYWMGQEKIVALKDINLKFEANKIYCIIGTSGSGKSTLLNLLAGLEVCMPLIFFFFLKKIRMAKAKEMLKLVGLENRLNHKPNQMSGGQQQRVSIARAFVNNPKVIFADEPTGNLDTKTTFEMMDLITGIAKKNNQTLIIVTHDLEISDYANVIIHIRDGNVDKIENKK